MTDFVESFTTQQMLPPWKSRGAHYWCFVIRVGRPCIQNYLDEHFNKQTDRPTPWHYAALNDHCFGVLMVAEHPHFSSTHPYMAGRSEVSHREVFWSFPARRFRRTTDNLLVEPTMVMTQPFSFDDNSYILFSSREIWGGEKQLATIHMEAGENADDLHVDVALKGFKKFSPRARSRNIGLMHIRLTPDARPVDKVEMFLGDEDRAIIAGTVLAFLPLFGGSAQSIPFVIDTLKQFRDVFDLRAATYRSIVSSHVVPENMRNVAVYRGDDVELNFMWSASMKEVLTNLFGLVPPDRQGPPLRSGDDRLHEAEEEIDWGMPYSQIDVAFAVSFDADMRFEALGSLYTY